MIPRPPDAGAEWVETRGSARVAEMTRYRVILANGAYTLAVGGRAVASFVADGSGGYTLTAGTLTGTGLVYRVGTGTVTLV